MENWGELFNLDPDINFTALAYLVMMDLNQNIRSRTSQTLEMFLFESGSKFYALITSFYLVRPEFRLIFF